MANRRLVHWQTILGEILHAVGDSDLVAPTEDAEGERKRRRKKRKRKRGERRMRRKTQSPKILKLMARSQARSR